MILFQVSYPEKLYRIHHPQSDYNTKQLKRIVEKATRMPPRSGCARGLKSLVERRAVLILTTRAANEYRPVEIGYYQPTGLLYNSTLDSTVTPQCVK
jgi:hypothetical protein